MVSKENKGVFRMNTKQVSETFQARLARHHDELSWLFMELYNDPAAFEELETMMAEAFSSRSAELRELDAKREADPEWCKRGNMFGMTMYTDLFAGDLNKFAGKIDYLKEQNLYLPASDAIVADAASQQRRWLCHRGL